MAEAAAAVGDTAAARLLAPSGATATASRWHLYDPGGKAFSLYKAPTFRPSPPRQMELPAQTRSHRMRRRSTYVQLWPGLGFPSLVSWSSTITECGSRPSNRNVQCSRLMFALPPTCRLPSVKAEGELPLKVCNTSPDSSATSLSISIKLNVVRRRSPLPQRSAAKPCIQPHCIHCPHELSEVVAGIFREFGVRVGSLVS